MPICVETVGDGHTRMIREDGFDFYVTVIDWFAVHFDKVDICGHVANFDRKVVRIHQPPKQRLKAFGSAASAVNAKLVSWNICRNKKRETLDMVPMRMRD